MWNRFLEYSGLIERRPGTVTIGIPTQRKESQNDQIFLTTKFRLSPTSRNRLNWKTWARQQYDQGISFFFSFIMAKKICSLCYDLLFFQCIHPKPLSLHFWNRSQYQQCRICPPSESAKHSINYLRWTVRFWRLSPSTNFMARVGWGAPPNYTESRYIAFTVRHKAQSISQRRLQGAGPGVCFWVGVAHFSHSGASQQYC